MCVVCTKHKKLLATKALCSKKEKGLDDIIVWMYVMCNAWYGWETKGIGDLVGD
jgi:hypothetical protein